MVILPFKPTKTTQNKLLEESLSKQTHKQEINLHTS